MSNLKEDKIESSEEKQKVYTKLFFQRPLTFRQAASWVFVHYLTIGMIQGYYQSVIFNVQSLGADFKSMSTLTLALHPYSFKFVISPFLDRFYVSRLGRSKTYIIIGGSVIGSVFCFLGPTINRMVQEIDVVPLTVLFAMVNSLVCVVQIAGESWILTMFSKEDKTKASTFLSIGQMLGVILGYNIFTPLNDLQWLNKNIFVEHPRDEAILSHQMFCFIVAILYFAQITVNLLFIAEERILSKKAKDICKILAIVPRHATNSHMRKFIGYMFACRFVYFMVDFSLDLKLIKNGYMNLSRSTVSNIDTLVYPFVFILSFCTIYYMKKGQLIKMFHLTMYVVLLTGVFRFLTYLDLTHNREVNRVILARVVSGLLTGMDFTTYFLISYFNTIVNKVYGNTGITCLIALMNQTASLPKTVGLLALQYVNYEVFVIACLCIAAILLTLMFPYSYVLDSKDAKLYALDNAGLISASRNKALAFCWERSTKCREKLRS